MSVVARSLWICERGRAGVTESCYTMKVSYHSSSLSGCIANQLQPACRAAQRCLRSVERGFGGKLQPEVVVCATHGAAGEPRRA